MPFCQPAGIKRAISTIVFLTLAGCASQTGENTDQPSNTATATQAKVEIRKSPNDDRDYRYLVLPNQLRVLLVSDPSSEKSAAALSVFRGSQHEPAERPGLAHFLEHMLFIQTDTYPEIDGFQNHVSANGGGSNAYTALDHTNYFFDIRPDAFDEGVSRFAHFFIDPVLSPDYAAREKNAVHSEYQMQMKDDGWRGYMASKNALNPEHPASNFTIGSLDTLAGDIHEDLTAFFDKQYSADQMALVVLTSRPLDEMQTLISPLFGVIANKNIGPAHPTVPFYTDEQLPARLAIRSVKDGASVNYQFPFPNPRSLYASKPEQYFANLLGHEGTGSLFQELKQRGWIESLGASVEEADFNTSVLMIGVELTPQGREHIDEITDLTFQYIDLLKSTDPQSWLYDEQATVAAMGFRFQEKSGALGFVYQLAPRIDKFPPADLLVAPYLMENFDAAKTRELMNYLTPENVIMEVRGSDIEGESIEPWFEVPYTLKHEPLVRNSSSTGSFALPVRNPFLPSNLDVKQGDELAPKLAINEPGLSLWLDTDTSFGTPKANLMLQIAVQDGFQTAHDRAIANLFRKMIDDSLSELVYPAYLAGLSYSLVTPQAGFELHVSGYHDKQSKLLSPVLNALLHGELSQERFDLLKESLIKDWRNTAKDRPFRQSYSALTDTLRSGTYPRPQLVAAMQPITLEDLTSWREQKLAKVAVRGMLHGNASNSDLQAVASMLRSELNLETVDFSRAQTRDIDGLLRLTLPVDHNDASLVLHVQDPDDSYVSRATSALAAQFLQPSYFEQLRTEQQLGYVVSVTNRNIENRGGITFIVQSPTTSAAGIEKATKVFMAEFIDAFIDAEPAEFEQHKAGLLTRLLESPKNLGEKSQKYWGDLTDDVMSFDSRQQIAQHVEALSKQDMITFVKRVHALLSTDRLLIFTQGGFDEVPSEGKLLDSATDSFGAD